MSTYSLKIWHTLNEIQGTMYKMIQMDITTDGLIPIQSAEEFVTVSDGTTDVMPFDGYLAHNQKKYYCFFTTDAFGGFTGNVDISFGYGEEVLHTFTSIPINAPSTIGALPAIFSGVTSVDADNLWLSTL